MNQETVLSALEDAEPDFALAELAGGQRSIDCPDLGSGRLVLPRYREVRHVLRAPGFACAPTAAGMLSMLSPDLRDLLAPVASWVLYSDAPTHPRIRSLLSKAFTARHARELKEGIVERAERLVQGFVAEGGGDAVTGLAEPLPVHTISMLLGLPEADRAQVKQWSDDVILVTEPELAPTQKERLAAAWGNLTVYFEGVIDDRRTRPGPDIVSGLLAAEADGEQLTRTEVIANCIALLVGGHETTSSLLSSIVLAADAHRDLRESILADGDTARGFVEEVLRLSGPSKITARTAVRDTEVFGLRVEAGRRLVLLQASANRDPEVFEAPPEFRPSRRPNPHLGFGYGPHACFGAALANMQAVAFVRALMRRTDDLVVERNAVTWKPSQVIRSAASVPVQRRTQAGVK